MFEHPYTLHALIHLIVPSSPRFIKFFSPMVVWATPVNANGQIQSYEIELIGSESGIMSANTTDAETYYSINNIQTALIGDIMMKASL